MKPYVIGIAGPSCAGKSYLSQHIAGKLGATLFHLDSYYRELDHLPVSERAHYNFDHPEALDSDLLFEQALALSTGESIEKPIYDFTTHTRVHATTRLVPSEFIIMEGLFALYWSELRGLQGTRVYVDLGEEICLERRIARDIAERGRTRESVLEQYHATVAPMARQFVYPTREHADIVVTGNDNIDNEVAAVLDHVIRGAREQSLRCDEALGAASR